MMLSEWAYQLAHNSEGVLRVISLDSHLDLTDVRDTVRAYCELAAAGENGIFNVGSGYVGIKEAMNLLGQPGGHSRPPMLPYTEEQKDQLRDILSDLGLLGPAAHKKSA